MSRRAEGKKVKQESLVIPLVAVRQEAGLGLPAVAERRAAIARPVPVRPPVERVGQASDVSLFLRVGVEVGAAGKGTREQERGVERGELAIPDATPGIDVEEVIEEPLVPGGVRLRSLRKVHEAPESAASGLRGELANEHAALDNRRDRRQGETDGRDAAWRVGVRFVTDQPIVGVGLVKVVQHRGPLKPGEFLVRRQPAQVLLCQRLVGHPLFLSSLPLAVPGYDSRVTGHT